MRSINTLQWHAGQDRVSPGSISLANALPVKFAKYALRALFYVPYQFNRYLNSLDEVTNPYRNPLRAAHAGKQDIMHQHIPSRVWQRRSALITALEEQHETVAREVPAEKIN